MKSIVLSLFLTLSLYGSSQVDTLTPTQLYSYTKGVVASDKHNSINYFLIGAGCSFLGSHGKTEVYFLSLTVPLVAQGISKPKLKHPVPRFTNKHYYVKGYKYQAKRKNLLYTLTGIALGSITGFLINN